MRSLYVFFETNMKGKLTELHTLLRDATIKCRLLPTLASNLRVRELVNEILTDFGLPMNKGYEEILVELGWVETLSEDIIDKILIKLADEGANYQTLSKLEEK
jgi:hypothetical protein